MITTADAAISRMEKLGYPPVFRQICEGKIPFELVGSCASPVSYFKIFNELVRIVPAASGWLPLWESDLESIVAFDSANDTYIRNYYGTNEVEILGNTYQQFVSAFLLELIDSGIWDELDHVAALFRYNHTNELREFVNSCDESDFQNSNRRFVQSIPD